MGIAKMMKFTGLVVIITVLLLAICLTACTPPKPAQQFTLRIGTFPSQDILPYLVMKEQGFDKKNGLQLVETSYRGGAAIIQDVADGSLDVGITGTVPVFSAAEQGVIPGKLIPVAANAFSDPDHPACGVLVSNSTTSWQQLKGQQVATNAMDSLNTPAIRLRLQQEGVTDFKLVEITFPNMGLAVAGGNIAAATMVEPFMTQSLLRKDGKLLGWIIGGPPFEKTVLTMIIFRADIYRTNPPAVKAFLRAHLQAVKWLNQNPDEARLILARGLNLVPEVAKEMRIISYPPDARIDPALLASLQTVLVDLGWLKKNIPLNQLYDETLLNEVLSEKR